MTKLFNEDDWSMLKARVKETAQTIAEVDGYATQDVEKAILDYCHDMLCTENFQLDPAEYIFDELESKKVLKK